MSDHLMFATPELERRFRRVVYDSSVEVGGYLFYTMAPLPGLDRRTLKGQLFYLSSQNKRIGYITNWIIVPNVSRQPHKEFAMAMNVDQMMATAQTTAVTHEAPLLVHFHTHPTGSASPSIDDIRHWFRHTRVVANKREVISVGVIISRWFDWRIWQVTYDVRKTPHPWTLKAFTYFSWKTTKALLRIKKENAALGLPGWS